MSGTARDRKHRFGRIFIPLDDVNASYDAAIFQLKHQFSGGLQVAGAYTWSHTIDTVSYEIGFQQTDPINQSLNRGSSDYDVRHNFVLSGLWEVSFLPYPKGLRRACSGRLDDQRRDEQALRIPIHGFNRSL